MNTDIDKANNTFTTAMSKAQEVLNTAITNATQARDTALTAAQNAFTGAIAAAQNAFTISTTAISNAAMNQLNALQTKAEQVQASLASLGVASSALGVTTGYNSYTPTLSTTSPNALGGTKDASNYTNYNVSVTGINLTDPNATAQQTVNALKFGTPIATNVSAPSVVSGTAARGN